MNLKEVQLTLILMQWKEMSKFNRYPARVTKKGARFHFYESPEGDRIRLTEHTHSKEVLECVYLSRRQKLGSYQVTFYRKIYDSLKDLMARLQHDDTDEGEFITTDPLP